MTSCVHNVALIALEWHTKIVKLQKYLEKKKPKHKKEKNRKHMVLEVRKELSIIYKQFPYSPNNSFLDGVFAYDVFVLFFNQIRALFKAGKQMSQVKLLHNLVQIFTGVKPYRDYPELESSYELFEYPSNYICYELVVVMCGNMINRFVEGGYLRFSPINSNCKEVEVHPSVIGGDRRMKLPTRDEYEQISSDSVLNHIVPPKIDCPAEHTRYRKQVNISKSNLSTSLPKRKF